jgi:hypothetical protein
MWKSYGILGGWLTAAIAISICWYMNHWSGLFDNPPGKLWVDQGWAVASAGLAWSVVRFHAQLLEALPVVACCLVGGAAAGWTAARIAQVETRTNLAAREKETL